MTKDAIALPAAQADAVQKQFASIIARADAGDNDALALLRTMYAELPVLVGTVTSLLENAERVALANYAPASRETMIAQLRQLRTNLAGADPSPLEQLLIDRSALDWLHSLEADRQCVLTQGESQELAVSDFYAKQAERAHRRLLRSTKTLAEIRRLNRPAVQVNIADKQVNVAGNVHAAKESLGQASAWNGCLCGW